MKEHQSPSWFRTLDMVKDSLVTISVMAAFMTLCGFVCRLFWTLFQLGWNLCQRLL